MKAVITTIDEYFENLPSERKPAMNKIRQTILQNLPQGFEEAVSYQAPGYVIPHRIYPAGYHCKPEEPLPFISVINQKHFIGFYHMGIYAKEELLEWFVNEYPKHCSHKLDMGKSCIRFKHMDDIPYDLIAELVRKISVRDWIQIYEESIKK